MRRWTLPSRAERGRVILSGAWTTSTCYKRLEIERVGQQRYKCQNTACPRYSFQLDLLYKGRAPAIKEQIVDMSLNGSGIRDTARVLKISPTTVINALKKKSLRSPR